MPENPAHFGLGGAEQYRVRRLRRSSTRTFNMISGTHVILRTAEADDAPDFRRLYYPAYPRPALLDRRREYPFPTTADLREFLTLGAKESGTPDMLAIEDPSGIIRGYCALRPAAVELAYTELAIMFHDNADCTSPMGSETLEILLRMAFTDKRLRKAVAHTLDDENELRALFATRGFQSGGVQRDVIYFEGRYHSMEALFLFNPSIVN
jgi:L-amino acid N-acyltransferase YncA